MLGCPFILAPSSPLLYFTGHSKGGSGFHMLKWEIRMSEIPNIPIIVKSDYHSTVPVRKNFFRLI